MRINALKIVCLCVCPFFVINAFAEPEWKLVWADEFDYEGLPDDEKWYFEHGPKWPNNELQFYTNARKENARVKDGVLTIEVHHEDYKGNKYTSARLNSKKGWTYGRMDIRAKLTVGEGLWPAIWMYPNKSIYGNWPASGEIDIMEYWSRDITGIYGTVHTTAFNHMDKTEKQGRIEIKDPAQAFHVYSIEWYPDQIKWFVDNNHYFTVKAEKGKAGYPFDHPFRFILNVAVEEKSPGHEDTWAKRSMEIDYVRVYQQ